jgi:hypothetical protein
MASVPRSIRRALLVSSMLAAAPLLLSSLGCKRAEDASDYDDDDRPRKKKHRLPKMEGRESGDGDGDDGDGNERGGRGGRGGGQTWYCAPSDVTACFDTSAGCRDRAKYLSNRPSCVTQDSVYCYTHDLYLGATYACFASMRDCQGDQSIAKNQERANQGTYYNVSKCQNW